MSEHASGLLIECGAETRFYVLRYSNSDSSPQPALGRNWLRPDGRLSSRFEYSPTGSRLGWSWADSSQPELQLFLNHSRGVQTVAGDSLDSLDARSQWGAFFVGAGFARAEMPAGGRSDTLRGQLGYGGFALSSEATKNARGWAHLQHSLALGAPLDASYSWRLTKESTPQLSQSLERSFALRRGLAEHKIGLRASRDRNLRDGVVTHGAEAKHALDYEVVRYHRALSDLQLACRAPAGCGVDAAALGYAFENRLGRASLRYFPVPGKLLFESSTWLFRQRAYLRIERPARGFALGVAAPARVDSTESCGVDLRGRRTPFESGVSLPLCASPFGRGVGLDAGFLFDRKEFEVDAALNWSPLSPGAPIGARIEVRTFFEEGTIRSARLHLSRHALAGKIASTCPGKAAQDVEVVLLAAPGGRELARAVTKADGSYEMEVPPGRAELSLELRKGKRIQALSHKKKLSELRSVFNATFPDHRKIRVQFLNDKDKSSSRSAGDLPLDLQNTVEELGQSIIDAEGACYAGSTLFLPEGVNDLIRRPELLPPGTRIGALEGWPLTGEGGVSDLTVYLWEEE